jgi:hypothetical protein
VEKDEGQMYAALFSAVRLTGITDSKSATLLIPFNIFFFG